MNDGKAFESFTVAAFKTRIITRQLSSCSSPSLFSFRSLFPADVSRLLDFRVGSISSDVTRRLKNFVGSPLYYLSPLGLEILSATSSSGGSNKRGMISALIEEVICGGSVTKSEVSFKCLEKAAPAIQLMGPLASLFYHHK